MAKDQSEDIPWGEGEKDQKVYEELCSVFASKKRHQTDAQTKKFLRQILNKKHPVTCFWIFSKLSLISKKNYYGNKKGVKIELCNTSGYIILEES